jgi:hypothetical protein
LRAGLSAKLKREELRSASSSQSITIGWPVASGGSKLALAQKAEKFHTLGVKSIAIVVAWQNQKYVLEIFPLSESSQARPALA